MMAQEQWVHGYLATYHGWRMERVIDDLKNDESEVNEARGLKAHFMRNGTKRFLEKVFQLAASKHAKEKDLHSRRDPPHILRQLPS